MARPPIIISNGGIAGKLALGLEEGAEGKIKDNVNDLNNETLKEINEKSNATASWIRWDNKNGPFIIWHLKGEDLSAFFREYYDGIPYRLEEIPDPDKVETPE